VAAGTRRMLARRWPDAEVAVVDLPPVEAILAHARKVDAGAIVMGSRGHGVVGRLLLGSVSRAVVRRADRPVLVVKRRPRSLTHFVVGLDGSANARRAVAFLAGLAVPRRGQVTLLRVVEPVRLPSTALMPGTVRAALNQQVARLNAERMAPARRDVDEAAAELQRAGWRVRKLVRSGTPLEELLAVARTARADCLVVGARGIGGVERLLLGSVAMGALDRATIPVLIVR